MSDFFDSDADLASGTPEPTPAPEPTAPEPVEAPVEDAEPAETVEVTFPAGLVDVAEGEDEVLVISNAEGTFEITPGDPIELPATAAQLVEDTIEQLSYSEEDAE